MKISKKKLIILGGLTLLAGLGFVRLKYPDRLAATSPSHTDETLRTRRYFQHGNLAQSKAEVEKIVSQLSTYGRNWRLVAAQNNSQANFNLPASNHLAIIDAEIPVLFFTDDMQIILRQGANPQEMAVDVKSAARFGRSDLGENRRHIGQLLHALDKSFTGYNARQ